MFNNDNNDDDDIMNSIGITSVHHIAIITSDYEKSKSFYMDILGFTIIKEVFRENRNSYKLDLALNNIYTIELFSFQNPPKRVSRPEACGLRHIAFKVKDLDKTVLYLQSKEVIVEHIRNDEHTGKRFTFIADPDDLPIEFYEASYI